MILVYLLQLLDSLIASFGILMMLSAGCALTFFSYEHIEDRKSCRLYWKMSVLAFFIFGILLVLTPSKKQAIEIIAVGSAIEYARNNEKIQQLPDKLVDCLDKYLTDIAE